MAVEEVEWMRGAFTSLLRSAWVASMAGEPTLCDEAAKDGAPEVGLRWGAGGDRVVDPLAGVGDPTRCGRRMGRGDGDLLPDGRGGGSRSVAMARSVPEFWVEVDAGAPIRADMLTWPVGPWLTVPATGTLGGVLGS